MATPRPWTTDDDTNLTSLHADGATLTAAARTMGRSKATVSRHAARLGLTWDRAATAAATEAKVLDAKARRAQLQLDLLGDAERLRSQLWQPTVVFNFGGKDNTYNETRLTEPTFADKLKIVQAAGIAVDRSLKLDLHDSAATATAVVGLLQQTATALGLHDDTDTQP